MYVAVRYQYLTVAADLILEGVTEPVRFKRYDLSVIVVFPSLCDYPWTDVVIQ